MIYSILSLSIPSNTSSWNLWYIVTSFRSNSLAFLTNIDILLECWYSMQNINLDILVLIVNKDTICQCIAVMQLFPIPSFKVTNHTKMNQYLFSLLYILRYIAHNCLLFRIRKLQNYKVQKTINVLSFLCVTRIQLIGLYLLWVDLLDKMALFQQEMAIQIFFL